MAWCCGSGAPSRSVPDPSLIAVRGAACHVDAEPRLTSPVPTGLCLLDQGIYKDFGTETL
jgi:hypothetical protein